MQSRPDPSSSDPACPLPFMATAAFTTGLIWLFALLGNLSLR